MKNTGSAFKPTTTKGALATEAKPARYREPETDGQVRNETDPFKRKSKLEADP